MEHLLLVLVATIVATKLLGELAQRLGQPAVLGELVAGVILGGSALGLFDPHHEVLHAFAEIGVIILLFEIGLHTDLRSLTKVGSAATMVAIVGVVLPFGTGFFVARAFGIDVLTSTMIGAALTATSVGISARVLSDLGQLQTPDGQVVLGAAVLDDVIGLIILAVVTAMVGGESVSALGISKITAVAVGFLVAAIALGSVAIPPLFRVVEKIRVTGTLGVVALAFAFLLALLAVKGGSAMIIGAFAAGLILHPTPQRAEIEKSVTTMGYFFVPIFFASVGAAVEVPALLSREALLIGGALVVVGALGKFAAGYAPWWHRGHRTMIGVAMVPRGEVGLIFAQMGLAAGVLDAGLYGALMLMVVATTFMTPPILGVVARRYRPDFADAPDASGIDDLVAGSHRRE